MNLIIFFILSLSHYVCIAQNLVLNGGFENYTCLPSNLGMLECAQDWFNPLYEGCQIPDICPSPDFLHVQSTGWATLPSNIIANVNPFEGEGISGFIGWNSASIREYISCQLYYPLVVGGRYLVRFQMTNGNANNTESGSGWGVSNIGIAFTTAQPIQSSHLNLSIEPHFNLDTVWYSNVWEEISFILFPDSSYLHLTIGNFYSDLDTDSFQFVQNTVTDFHNAHYFIDNVSVTRLDSTSSVFETPSIVDQIRQDQDNITICLTIQKAGHTAVSLYDMTGKQAANYNTQGQKTVMLPIGYLSKGIYILNVETPQGSARRKVIIP